MAEVNDLYRLFEKRVLSLVKQRGSARKETLLFYLRVYNNLLNALNLMNTPLNRRSFHFLKIIVTLTSKEAFKGEAHYLSYINSITREILSSESRIRAIVGKNPASDPLHANTKLIMAQNICLLRILKLSRVT